MKIQCAGKCTGTLNDIRIGRAIVLPPQKNYHGSEPIRGKEIIFPCNIHDVDISDGKFVMTISIKNDSLHEYEDDIISLSFIIPAHQKEQYTFTKVALLTESKNIISLTDATTLVYDDDGSWVIGEKEILFPPFGKIKQMLINKGEKQEMMSNEKDHNDVVANSEPVSLDTVIASYQAEMQKSTDYEKE